MLRVIREARPAWIIGENVAGIVNLALDTVCADLEAEGYEVEPVIVPACAVDAPHKRDRVWIVAHAPCVGRGGRGHGNEAGNDRALQTSGSCAGEEQPVLADSKERQDNKRKRGDMEEAEFRGESCNTASFVGRENVANAQGGKRGEIRVKGKEEGAQCGHVVSGIGGGLGGELCPGNVADAQGVGVQGHRTSWIKEPQTHGRKGLLVRKSQGPQTAQWLPEPDVGRVAHGVPNRVHRLKGLGNAIVPQVAAEIIRCIGEVSR